MLVACFCESFRYALIFGFIGWFIGLMIECYKECSDHETEDYNNFF